MAIKLEHSIYYMIKDMYTRQYGYISPIIWYICTALLNIPSGCNSWLPDTIFPPILDHLFQRVPPLFRDTRLANRACRYVCRSDSIHSILHRREQSINRYLLRAYTKLLARVDVSSYIDELRKLAGAEGPRGGTRRETIPSGIPGVNWRRIFGKRVENSLGFSPAKTIAQGATCTFDSTSLRVFSSASFSPALRDYDGALTSLPQIHLAASRRHVCDESGLR